MSHRLARLDFRLMSLEVAAVVSRHLFTKTDSLQNRGRLDQQKAFGSPVGEAVALQRRQMGDVAEGVHRTCDILGRSIGMVHDPPVRAVVVVLANDAFLAEQGPCAAEGVSVRRVAA